MMNSSFQNVEVNPDAAARNLLQRAHNQDGLPEIVVGIIFLFVAGLMQLPVRHVWEAWIAFLGMTFLVPVMSGGSPWAIRKLRRHFLIERVGYVEPKPANRGRVVFVLGIACVVSALAAFATWHWALPPASWAVAGIGILGGALAAIAGRIPRFYVGGGIMAVVGIIVGLSKVSLGTGQAILYGIMGLLSLISGCVVLLLFVRKRDEVGE